MTTDAHTPSDTPLMDAAAKRTSGTILETGKKLERELAAVRGRLADALKVFESNKRESDLITADEWRQRAMHYEYQWSNCSRCCAEIQGRAESAESALAAAKAEFRKVGALIPMAGGGTFENDPPDAIVDALKRHMDGIVQLLESQRQQYADKCLELIAAKAEAEALREKLHNISNEFPAVYQRGLRDGSKQGLLRAAEICDKEFRRDDLTGDYRYGAGICAKAIRAEAEKS